MNTLEQENSLIKGLASNNKQAIESIYKDNFTVIQGFILKNNGTVDEARDIFQEAMIVLYQKALTGQFELTCQLRTYIFSVCRRLWLKRLQQMNRFSNNTDHIAETISVEEEIEAHEKYNSDINLMENAMSKLGEPCKSLLDAYYTQKKNMQDIATEFGYTNADNAKTQKYKCLMRLKKIFFAEYKNGN